MNVSSWQLLNTACNCKWTGFLLTYKGFRDRRLDSTTPCKYEVQGKHKAAVCIPNLVHQLYASDHDMYMNALLALRSIAESPSSREILLKVLEDDPDMRATLLKDLQIHLAAYRYEPNKPPRV